MRKTATYLLPSWNLVSCFTEFLSRKELENWQRFVRSWSLYSGNSPIEKQQNWFHISSIKIYLIVLANVPRVVALSYPQKLYSAHCSLLAAYCCSLLTAHCSLYSSAAHFTICYSTTSTFHLCHSHLAPPALVSLCSLPSLAVRSSCTYPDICAYL